MRMEVPVGPRNKAVKVGWLRDASPARDLSIWATLPHFSAAAYIDQRKTVKWKDEE